MLNETIPDTQVEIDKDTILKRTSSEGLNLAENSDIFDESHTTIRALAKSGFESESTAELAQRNPDFLLQYLAGPHLIYKEKDDNLPAPAESSTLYLATSYNKAIKGRGQRQAIGFDLENFGVITGTQLKREKKSDPHNRKLYIPFSLKGILATGNTRTLITVREIGINVPFLMFIKRNGTIEVETGFRETTVPQGKTIFDAVYRQSTYKSLQEWLKSIG